MNNAMHERMRETMRLMKTGDLRAATAALQPSARHTSEPSRSASEQSALDGEFSVVSSDDATLSQPVGAQRARPEARAAAFHRRAFSCRVGARNYRLFVPSAYCGEPMPLVVMLHGCTQTPEDFALGTRMNAHAETRGCLVAYPQQTERHNGSKCWNWFKPTDQQRDAGEPAIIAGIVGAIAAEFSVDSTRIYAAGLSAGASMAVILGETYPDVFAAVGVHSGLAFATAHDVPSAFAAMRDPGTGAQPSRNAGGRRARSHAVPAIVFHGDRDPTVNISNGRRVVDDAIAFVAAGRNLRADDAPMRRSVLIGKSAGGRAFTRTVYTQCGPDAQSNAAVAAEFWVIEGAGHTWSGGEARGSHTDPKGPDASAEMLRFFLDHGRRA